MLQQQYEKKVEQMNSISIVYDFSNWISVSYLFFSFFFFLFFIDVVVSVCATINRLRSKSQNDNFNAPNGLNSILISQTFWAKCILYTTQWHEWFHCYCVALIHTCTQGRQYASLKYIVGIFILYLTNEKKTLYTRKEAEDEIQVD